MYCKIPTILRRRATFFRPRATRELGPPIVERLRAGEAIDDRTQWSRRMSISSLDPDSFPGGTYDCDWWRLPPVRRQELIGESEGRGSIGLGGLA